MSGGFVSRFFDRETVPDGKFRRQTVDRVAEQLAGSGGSLALVDDAAIPMQLALTGRRFERPAQLCRNTPNPKWNAGSVERSPGRGHSQRRSAATTG